ncbi:hypothetical protein O0L34_g10888 [Tuta absoluta]|nr:hypothetical protein O0L34_g10888 [Tuta absoluta]
MRISLLSYSPGLNHEQASPGGDVPDNCPTTPHSPEQRRLLSRSFDLDELPPSEANPAPRCSSADHLLSLATEHPHRESRRGAASEPGQELVLTLRRGAAGFGFTIADSVHGQKVKKVLDRSRCAGLREGDLLLQIGEHDVTHAPHQHVVQVLKDCPALHETALRVWRRNNSVARAPRSRSATRVHPNVPTNTQMSNRSKTPTAEQLRSPQLHAQDNFGDRLNGMNSEATYAVPEHKSRERESLIDRRRRSSTPGGRLTLPAVSSWTEPENNNNQWQERETWIDNSSNIRNWAESQKWDNNNQKWDNNGQKWDNNPQPQHSSQQWDQNGQKWDQNGQKWDQNGQKWDQNGQKWDQNGQKWDQNSQKWDQNGQKWEQEGVNNGNGWEGRGGGAGWGGASWGEVPTPTVHVDMGAAYWRGNASLADSSDNGGFPEDGMMHSPTTAAISGLTRQSPSSTRMRPHSPSNSGRLRSHSPSTASATDRLLANSPSTRLQSQSPSNNSSNGRIKGSPMRHRENSPSRHMHSPARRSPSCYEGDSLAQQSTAYIANYPQVEAGGTTDPEADVLVRLARGSAGFGFRIVGGTEDGSRVAVGYVVPGGPADGLLRPGDLLTSVDGIPLAGATHARAVAYVCQAASRGHVTLGVRHNRADIQSLGLPQMAAQHPHQPLLTEPPVQLPPAAYNILHPAPLYPPHANMYGVQYDNGSAGWSPVPYDVTVTRNEGEGFGFVVISSTNKATSTIGQLIPNSPAARCGSLHVGDTILAINRMPIRNLPHPEVVALIKHSGTTVTLTVVPPDGWQH